MELDALIDLAISYGNAHGGGRMKGAHIRPVTADPQKCRRRRAFRMAAWSVDELQYIRDNIARMTVDELSAALGRSVNAVHIVVVRQGIPVASKQPGWMTGNAVARATGMDIHSVMLLHKLGRLPMEVLPGQRGILRIKKVTLYRWATRWQNWLYFKPHRMGDTHLRRLVELAQSRWDDAWWSVGKVANYHKVDQRSINAKIRRGKLPAIRWGNWYVLRSVAMQAEFFHGKGHNCLLHWSPRADEFLLRARAEGKTWAEIGRMMKWPAGRVTYRWNLLQKGNQK